MHTTTEAGTNSDKPVLQGLLANPQQVHFMWPHIYPLLQKGRSTWNKRWDASDIYNDLKEGKMQAWLVNDDLEVFLVAITTVLRFPKYGELYVITVCGERLLEALQLFDYMKIMAKRWGCNCIRAESLHKGLVRMLNKEGLESTTCGLELDISSVKEH